MNRSIIGVLVLFIISPYALASGSFVPGGGGAQGEQYNLGKSIVKGHLKNEQACSNCHKKFKRSQLKALKVPVSDLITNCEQHNPCFNGVFDDKSLEALNVYFKKRYNLR